MVNSEFGKCAIIIVNTINHKRVEIMQRNTPTLQELKDILFKTKTYKEAQHTFSFKNKCAIYTEKLFDEIKNSTQSIKVSANRGEHYFLLCNTSDHGIVIVDPSYFQMFKSMQKIIHFSLGHAKNYGNWHKRIINIALDSLLKTGLSQQELSRQMKNRCGYLISI